jgi:hypothetical protein
MYTACWTALALTPDKLSVSSSTTGSSSLGGYQMNLLTRSGDNALPISRRLLVAR